MAAASGVTVGNYAPLVCCFVVSLAKNKHVTRTASPREPSLPGYGNKFLDP